ncbi:hypothetical protein SAMD00019534_090590 [Acytostelium subglobosum LB1]|uniref:hypothetical protein n=1 Tax=Acytostelium subglobosum LB1 TaxID=1410327 RepID=UPI000644CB09|nr:hypothetical protein SAMD00019534_090590 [Acytostelium subglobosum LB1]GAM25884.1 hypothetical protein SAMD00019534_090590 [Acytostelium subglobosum LB1]|eukprot:XP_012750927.1 hypothetical protein SAMD00019534_090590 [Acytostelium subglobosum LB1]
MTEKLCPEKLIDVLDIPLIILNIIRDQDDLIYTGVANAYLLKIVGTSSDNLIESIIGMPSPPSSPTFLPTTLSSSRVRSPDTLSSEFSQLPTPSTLPHARPHRRPSIKGGFIVNKFDPIIAIDFKKSYQLNNGIVSEETTSLIECIQSAFLDGHRVEMPVFVSNLTTNRQYSATMVVSPFLNGCACCFQQIEEKVELPEIEPVSIPTPTAVFHSPLVRAYYDMLDYVCKDLPVIIWRTNSAGEISGFKKMDSVKCLADRLPDGVCKGKTIDDFVNWVPSSLNDQFKDTFTNEIANNDVKIHFLYWFLTPEEHYPMLYVFRGFAIKEADNNVGWVGMSYSYLMNEGPHIAIKSQYNLEFLCQRVKTLCEAPDKLKLDYEDISSGSSFEHFMQTGKISLSNEEHSTFLMARERYNVLFRLSLLGVMFSTLSGTIVDANDALLSIIGYSRSELEQGQVNWMKLTPPEFSEISARALLELKAKRWCQPIEKAYTHKSGKRVPILVTAVMIDGSSEQCITFVFDLSRYRQAEESAIQATNLKTQFLANISHELRTPCHGILGMSQMLLDSKLNDPQRDCAETIKRSTDTLITLINDMLDFSKIESGNMTLELAEFQLVPMIEEIIDLHSEAANKKDIDVYFVMSRDHPVPPVLIGDRRRILQVLVKVVSNAVKFTERGHVLIEVSTEYECGDQISLRFSVIDTGIGISDANMKQIFTPFCQADGSSSRRHGGTGLSLSYCKNLINLMSGTLHFESQLGQGTNFSFSLKLLLGSPTYLPTDVPAANQFFYPEYKPFKSECKMVLLVESNEHACTSIKTVLKTLGYIYKICQSIDMAIDQFKQAKQSQSPFDIVIASDSSGNIRTLLALITTEKVIVYGSESRAAALADHQYISSFLVKPLKPTKLITAILKYHQPSNVQKNNHNNNNINNINNNNNSNNNVSDNQGNTKCILVAEDNKTNEKVITAHLTKLGFQSLVCANGQKILDAIAMENQQFSLILMDCQMPVMDGFVCSRIIRELEPNGQRIPIIAMTANNSEDQCKAAGMDDYLAKPVKMESLKNTISQWLPKDDVVHSFYPRDGSPSYSQFAASL